MRNLIIEKKYNNVSLCKIISKEFPQLSKNSLYKLFRLKDIKVNNIRIKEDLIVQENDIVTIYADDTILFGIPKNIVYYYEDDNILVAYKPKGIISINEEDTISDTCCPSFEDLVKKDKSASCTDIQICHRLDTNTEGLVIFSKNSFAHDELLTAFKDGNIHKSYIAFVVGKMEQNHDILSGYIIKDAKTSYCKISTKNLPGSQTVKTEYTVLKYIKDKNISVLEIALHTGRTHQIRAHMKSIGHPLVGDSKYGINDINRSLGYKSQLLFATKYSFDFEPTSILNYLNDKVISIDINRIISII